MFYAVTTAIEPLRPISGGSGEASSPLQLLYRRQPRTRAHSCRPQSTLPRPWARARHAMPRPSQKEDKRPSATWLRSLPGPAFSAAQHGTATELQLYQVERASPLLCPGALQKTKIRLVTRQVTNECLVTESQGSCTICCIPSASQIPCAGAIRLHRLTAISASRRLVQFCVCAGHWSMVSCVVAQGVLRTQCNLQGTALVVESNHQKIGPSSSPPLSASSRPSSSNPNPP